MRNIRCSCSPNAKVCDQCSVIFCTTMLSCFCVLYLRNFVLWHDESFIWSFCFEYALRLRQSLTSTCRSISDVSLIMFNFCFSWCFIIFFKSLYICYILQFSGHVFITKFSIFEFEYLFERWMYVLLQMIHVVLENGIRFFISATKNIAAGTEITIPFSYDYRTWYLQFLCITLLCFIRIGLRATKPCCFS